VVRSSAFLCTLLMVAIGIWLLSELSFLAPYRNLILASRSRSIIVFICLVAINLFGAILAVNRRLFLRDTGRKLAHVEKQLRTGSSISEELTERLGE
jgi:hypothetical protein